MRCGRRGFLGHSLTLHRRGPRADPGTQVATIAMPMYAILPVFNEYCIERGWTRAYTRCVTGAIATFFCVHARRDVLLRARARVWGGVGRGA